MIDDTDIVRFQELYKKHFNQEITPEEAYEKGVKLLGLTKLIYRPMSTDEYEQLQTRRKETSDL